MLRSNESDAHSTTLHLDIQVPATREGYLSTSVMSLNLFPHT